MLKYLAYPGLVVFVIAYLGIVKKYMTDQRVVFASLTSFSGWLGVYALQALYSVGLVATILAWCVETTLNVRVYNILRLIMLVVLTLSSASYLERYKRHSGPK